MFGNLVIDLTDLPRDGETVDLEARVDAGNIEIWLPWCGEARG